MKLRITLIGLLMLFLLGGCSGTSSTPIDAGDFPDWQVRKPEVVGLNSKKLQAVIDYVSQPEMNTQGIAIIKDGYLVAEWYHEDYTANDYATSWSVGKSFASATVGILFDEGLIKNLDVLMTDFVPEWKGTDKEKITLRDILTMSSGLDWDETYNLSGSEPSDVARMVLESRPMEIAVSQPVVHPAGTVFNYSSGDTMLLSRVVKTLSGKNPTDFASERLFKPLGMTQIDWWIDSEGNTYTFCCVDSTVRNFAKFGQLYLQDGVWGGRQLLSKEWVRMTTQETANGNRGYGLQWWLNVPNDEYHLPSVPDNAYFALGHDQQSITVLPTQNMIVVRNGLYTKPEGLAVAEQSLFADGLLSDAIGSTGSIPPDGDWSNDVFLSLVLAVLE